MKDLITTIASLSVLMVFVLQFSANQMVITRILAADQISDSYDMIRAQEDFEASNTGEIISKLAGVFNCETEEVKISDDGKSYHIKAPIRNIIACGEFLGISDEENKAYYHFKGEVK